MSSVVCAVVYNAALEDGVAREGESAGMRTTAGLADVLGG